MYRFILLILLMTYSLLIKGQNNHISLSEEDKKMYEFVQSISKKNFTDIDKIIESLVVKAKTPEDTIKLFYLWLADNIAYDTKSFSSGSIESYTAKETIKRKKAVCSGYSTVFKEMCDYVGIKCYLVNGYSKGFGYKNGSKFKQSDHAWNAVFINEEWRLVDPTWGAGYVEMKNGSLKFSKRLDMSYFYTSPEEFILRHLPADPTWQLLNNIVSMQVYIKFNNKEDILKKVSDDFFNFNDSIFYLEKLNEHEKLIKQAENAYNFFPGDPNYLGVHYYNYAITLSEDNTNKEQLKKALVYYTKAKNIYSKNKIPNSKSILSSIKQGVEYVEFYLKKNE